MYLGVCTTMESPHHGGGCRTLEFCVVLQVLNNSGKFIGLRGKFLFYSIVWICNTSMRMASVQMLCRNQPRYILLYPASPVVVFISALSSASSPVANAACPAPSLFYPVGQEKGALERSMPDGVFPQHRRRFNSTCLVHVVFNIFEWGSQNST